MRTDTAAFYDKNTAPDKDPRYTIEIAFDSANTILRYATSHADAKHPTGATVIYSVVQGISGTSQKINPDQAVASIGSISFNLTDKNNQVRDLQFDQYTLGYSLRGMRVRVYMGFDGLDWADYSLIQTQIIESVKYKDGQYNFVCSDVQRLTREDIFDLATNNLFTDITATQTTITVYSTTGFTLVAHGTSYSDAPSSTVGYIRIDDEIIRYTGTTSTTFTGCTRGALNTRAVEHTIDPVASQERRTEVTEVVYLEMPVPKLIYALLTGNIYEPENLLTYSEQFDHASWLTYQPAIITANTSIAPDETLTVDTLQDDSAILTKVVLKTISISDTASNYTASINVKKDSTPRTTRFVSLRIKFDGSTAEYNYLYLDTSNGEYNFYSVAGDPDSIVSVESNNDYWFISLSSKSQDAANTTAGFWFIPAQGASATWAQSVAATGSAEVWGAQLVKGSLPGKYYKTEATALIPSYATLPTSWHLGISTDFVRLSDFTGIGADWWDPADDTIGVPAYFVGLEKQDGKRFIEKELLLLLGAFMPVYTDGALGLKRMVRILTDAPYSGILDETNITSYSELTHDFPSLHNVIKLNWNYDPIKDKTTRSNVMIDSDSIAVHGSAKPYELTFKGLDADEYTLAALNNRFDALRDRYTGPPLLFNVSSLPSTNAVEVGDILRVKLDNIQDFVAGTSLDRSFEVQNIQVNWITGKVGLSLFSSSQDAAPIEWSGVASNLDDTFYTSEGNNLATYVGGGYDATTDFYESGGVGHIGANCQLTGGTTTTNAANIFYYDGPLTIDATFVVTITQNVQIRYKGFLTINGDIDGAGNGLSGSAGATTYNQYSDGWHSPGQTGIGSTKAGGGFQGFGDAIGGYSIDSKPTVGRSLELRTLVNNGTTLDGVPVDLRGTSGGGGMPFPQVPFSVTKAGGAGGAGGAGLLLIGRGLDIGAAGSINLSGANGAQGVLQSEFGYIGYTGTGAGGYPGGLYIINDGNDVVDQITSSNFIANRGTTTPRGTPLTEARSSVVRIANFYSYYVGFFGINRAHWASNFKVDYVPADETAEADQTEYPPDVTNFTAFQNGDVTVLKWTAVDYEGDLGGYEIRYSPTTINNFADATPLTIETKGTNITTADLPPGSWRIYIKAVDRITKEKSFNAATATVTVTTSFNVIHQIQQAPDWLGTLTNYLKHYTGKLVVESTKAANAHTNTELFEQHVPYPEAQSIYESPEYDIDFDDTVRSWGDVDSVLGPGKTGIADPQLQIDSRLAAGSYDGFENWSNGLLTARYIKHRIVQDNTIGVAVVNGFQPTVDILEHTERVSGVDITLTSPAGQLVTFVQPFHTTPFVKVFNYENSAKQPVAVNPTATGFTAYVYDMATGADTSGSISYEATGE